MFQHALDQSDTLGRRHITFDRPYGTFALTETVVPQLPSLLTLSKVLFVAPARRHALNHSISHRRILYLRHSAHKKQENDTHHYLDEPEY